MTITTPPPILGEGSLLEESPRMLVAGSWRSAEATRPVTNPATGAVFTEVPSADASHVDEAVAAAVHAQREWARRPVAERAAVLAEVVRLVEQNAEELAALVVAEQGKTITEARGEIQGVVAFFDFALSQKYRTEGEVVTPSSAQRQLIVREEPLGVVVAIIPWNFPAAIFARKVAPALMTGNAIIVKPSDVTPLSSLALARLCQRAGVPDGLLSVLTGRGSVVGTALIDHPETAMVTVTGSTRAGIDILERAAKKVIPVSLELGGKAPFIVFGDADLPRAVEDAFEARFMNCGQVCTCNERTYVHRSVFDAFVAQLVEKVRGLRVGDPMDDESQMGPKVSGEEWSKVDEMVRAAVAAGAQVEVGGGRPEGRDEDPGFWFAPTVLTGVSNDMDIVQQEVFGPVLPIVPFDDYDEVIRFANSTPYGLTAYVYTTDIRTAMQATDDLAFGEVYVNRVGPEEVAGFHTGWKMSGLGGDDGHHGFERYTQRKTVYVDYSRDR
ncbi:aldehyde dehydrogenase family protein [Microbacterium sp. CH1]|uniref:aldehyde dehydrogenase family protein n=1 Tax=Microbacterium sp. CH1 TaxID=1770208 RepID=UPI000788ACE9|nr:aldehyde dehydrogenase family protein [Microbacterium sp. CH1]KYK00121.1 aldehyde dehydrogenase [Microbacterium sp. CH1]